MTGSAARLIVVLIIVHQQMINLLRLQGRGLGSKVEADQDLIALKEDITKEGRIRGPGVSLTLGRCRTEAGIGHEAAHVHPNVTNPQGIRIRGHGHTVLGENIVATAIEDENFIGVTPEALCPTGEGMLEAGIIPILADAWVCLD